MDNLVYTSGVRPDLSVGLDGPVSYVGTAEGIRGRSWAYEMGNKSLRLSARTARTASITLSTSFEQADEFRRLADADMCDGSPGVFTAHGGWKQRGFVLSSKPKGIYRGWLETELTIALLDGAWWKLGKVSLMPGRDSSSGGGLDYAYDYGHDYSPPSTGGALDTESLVPCKPRLVFYGPVTDPYIIVAGNKYQVNGNIANGARVEVDGKDKTVRLIGQDGSVTDKFADALRGSGEGGGEYVFQPFPPGSSDVTWDDSFGVDIMWYREAGEPPWSQSS